MAFDKLRTYIMEDEFEVKLLNNRIDILNYETIDHLDSNKIIIRYMVKKTIMEIPNIK